MDLVSVLTAMLLIAAILLCISLIYYLNKITKSFEEIKNNIKVLSLDIKPLIESTTQLSERLSNVTYEVQNQIDVTRNMIMGVKNRVDMILSFEEKVRRGIEQPILGLIKNFSAVINGINAFWNAYKKQ